MSFKLLIVILWNIVHVINDIYYSSMEELIASKAKLEKLLIQFVQNPTMSQWMNQLMVLMI